MVMNRGVNVVDICMARQPILNRNQEVLAYELLYRNNQKENYFAHFDGEQATSDVMNNVIQFGFDMLSDGKPCFINFTEKFIENMLLTPFKTNMVVVEVLETVRLTDKVVEGCKKLKELGFKIVLDDFFMQEKEINFYKLLTLADIVKIDIRETSRTEQRRIFQMLKPFNIQFLAEKVETRAEYEQCLQDGYVYFQGYFFSKPTILTGKDIPLQSQSVLLIMNELAKDEPDITKLTQIIKNDLSMSYKLLKLINSSMLGPVNEIKSIQQAIVYLGLRELKKWVYVLSFRENVCDLDQKFIEVVKMSLTRAKACELICMEIGEHRKGSNYFFIGLFSLMDTLMNQPLTKMVEELALDDEVKKTLMGEKTNYTSVFDMVVALEKADWLRIHMLVDALGLDNQLVFRIYRQSIRWANKIMEQDENN